MWLLACAMAVRRKLPVMVPRRSNTTPKGTSTPANSSTRRHSVPTPEINTSPTSREHANTEIFGRRPDYRRWRHRSVQHSGGGAFTPWRKD